MIKFNVTTYNAYTHNLIVETCTRNGAAFHARELNDEQGFSKFIIKGSQETFNQIREISERNDGNVISYEYGDE